MLSTLLSSQLWATPISAPVNEHSSARCDTERELSIFLSTSSALVLSNEGAIVPLALDVRRLFMVESVNGGFLQTETTSRQLHEVNIIFPYV